MSELDGQEAQKDNSNLGVPPLMLKSHEQNPSYFSIQYPFAGRNLGIKPQKPLANSAPEVEYRRQGGPVSV
jgi:hypothetical protein